MRSLLLAGIALLTCTFASAQNSWLRVRVDVPNTAQFDRLVNSNLRLFQCDPTLGTTDIIVPPGRLSDVTLSGFTYSIVGPLPDPTNWEAKRFGIQASDYRNEYFNLNEIYGFFDTLVSGAKKFVSRRTIGTSIQGRPIYAYLFSGPVPSSGTQPKAIVLTGLIHAREWISGSVVMHLGKMLRDDLVNTRGAGVLKGKQVWIVPVHNPDGFNYTWTNDRYWRKNRRANSGGSFGVDVNRNYAKGWGGGGSSGSGGSDTYRGTAAFSEPESKAVRDLVLSLPRVGGFIDFHSYSQLLLWPWSYTSAVPPDAASLQSIAIATKAALDSHGATYVQGQCYPTLYQASGVTVDWFYGQYQIPSYTIELRDTGTFGFVLPANQITPTQDEAYDGFKVFMNSIAP